MKNPSRIAWVFLGVSFCVGLAIERFFHPLGFLPIGGKTGSTTIIRQAPDKEHPLINPLLMVDVQMSERSSEFSELRSTFQSIIDTQKKSGAIDSASVFFRDFSDGQWVSINPNMQYSPASLLKIPLMIAFFKEAESDPGILQERVLYDGSFDLNTLEGVFAPSHQLKAGSTYTVEELIHHMVTYSDNNAVYLLSKHIDPSEQNEVYTDLGLSVPPDTTDSTVDFMTVKNYASFFRVLYSSTYLTREYSEKALEYLTQSDFANGIRAGVPSGITVADKFGERTQYAADGTISEEELHDCGVVYDAKRPYVLCVMTKAKTFSGATELVKDISQAAYSVVKMGT